MNAVVLLAPYLTPFIAPAVILLVGYLLFGMDATEIDDD